MRAVFISYCVVSNAEAATKFPVMLITSTSVIPHDGIRSVFFLLKLGHMSVVQRTPKICKVKISKAGSKSEYHFCKVKLGTRAYKEKYSL